MKKNLAIILAGGAGLRFKEETPKQFLKLAGKLIIEHTLEKFEDHLAIDDIFIVTNSDYYQKTQEVVEKNNYKKVKKILNGGSSRQESSEIGLIAGEGDYENVFLHDAVRPFISKEIINEMLKKLKKYESIDVAIPSPDTIIQINSDQVIKDIPDRSYLRRGQTPQAFKLKTILKAHRLARKKGITNATDDCSLILKLKLADTYVVEGSNFNVKITYPIDIHIADKIFQLRNETLNGTDDELLKKNLKDKVIVVFGGSSGIGKSICKLAKKYKAAPYSLSLSEGVDIRDHKKIKDALKKIYKERKKIDIVIITAAVLKLGFIENMEMDEIMTQINTNLTGNIYVAKESIPYLKETNGHLVFFASSSYTRGRAGYTLYSTSKSGIVNFAQGLADELSKYQIKVNVINPERTSTPMRKKNFGKEEEGLLLNPEFVAQKTLMLFAKDMTGAIIDIRKVDEKQ